MTTHFRCKTPSWDLTLNQTSAWWTRRWSGGAMRNVVARGEVGEGWALVWPAMCLVVARPHYQHYGETLPLKPGGALRRSALRRLEK